MRFNPAMHDNPMRAHIIPRRPIFVTINRFDPGIEFSPGWRMWQLFNSSTPCTQHRFRQLFRRHNILKDGELEMAGRHIIALGYSTITALHLTAGPRVTYSWNDGGDFLWSAMPWMGDTGVIPGMPEHMICASLFLEEVYANYCKTKED